MYNTWCICTHNDSSVVPVPPELLCLKDAEMSLLPGLVYHINLEFKKMKPNTCSIIKFAPMTDLSACLFEDCLSADDKLVGLIVHEIHLWNGQYHETVYCYQKPNMSCTQAKLYQQFFFLPMSEDGRSTLSGTVGVSNCAWFCSLWGVIVILGSWLNGTGCCVSYTCIEHHV